MQPAAPSPRDTIGSRLAERRTVGFDYQRLILALLVLVWHSYGVVEGRDVGNLEWYTLGMRAVLPLFFALSGFLVASSMDRLHHLPTFLLMRALRILPALGVETLLSAFILGPIFTTLSLGAYFTHPEFRDYLLNIVGWVHFALPGVFKDHLTSKVNASLWTVPFELECYIAISVLFLLGAFKRAAVMVAILVAFTALCAFLYSDYSYEYSPLVPGRLLIGYFIAGNVIYKLRYKLPAGYLLGWAMVIVSIGLLINVSTTWLSPLPVAYASALLGCTKPKRIPVIFDGDYSYGIYLYAFPMQQTVYRLLGPEQAVWQNALIATITTAVFAAFSWHAIEKPTVGLKQRIKRRKLSAEPAVPAAALATLPDTVPNTAEVSR